MNSKNTVYIIGNGPSLLDFNLSILKDNITIGCNSIDRMPNFTPTYHCITDSYFFKFHGTHLDKFFQRNSTFIFSYETVEWLQKNHPNIYSKFNHKIKKVDIVKTIPLNSVNSLLIDKDFNTTFDARNTIMHFSIPLAVWLEFKHIILVGIDCNKEYLHFYDCDEISQKKQDEEYENMWKKLNIKPLGPRSINISQQKRQKHFDNFLKIKELADKENISILNASTPSKSLLNVFPRTSFIL